MSTHENGGPAFPVGFQHGESIAMKGGMSLRDYFAAKAMTAMVSAGFQSGAFSSADTSGICAAGAYEIADAMLKERAK